MGLPKLNSFCCGCSLKTGTIIIGSLHLVLSVILGGGVSGMIFPACLIYGARTANKWLMMPWIIFTPIGLVFYTIYPVLYTINSFDISNIVSIVSTVSSLLGWLLLAYFLLVVWNYKNQVVEAGPWARTLVEAGVDTRMPAKESCL